MFQKIVTSVQTNGTISTEKRGTVAPADVERDMAEELHRIGNIARSDRGSRILTVEDAQNTIVVIYVHGAVKVYHWVAGAEQL